MKKIFLSKKIMIFYLFFIMIFNLFGFSKHNQKKLPYSIKGEFVFLSEDEYFFEFSFKNITEKIVKEFEVCFYLFDQNGEPLFFNNDCFTYHLDFIVEENQKIEFILDCKNGNFIDFFEQTENSAEIDFDSYFIDYLFVSKIIYDDQTQWQDKNGEIAF